MAINGKAGVTLGKTIGNFASKLFGKTTKKVTTPKVTKTVQKAKPTPASTSKVGSNLTKKASSSFTPIIAGAGLGALATSVLTPLIDGLNSTVIEDPEIVYVPYEETTTTVLPGEEGSTAYLGEDGYGESGTVIEETVSTLKQYAPYLIGFAVVIVIVALITGNRSTNTKKKGGRKK